MVPGTAATERQLARWWTPEGDAQTLADEALKKRITPDEFVQMVLFLAAADGGGCTAQTFLVDGGISCSIWWRVVRPQGGAREGRKGGALAPRR